MGNHYWDILVTTFCVCMMIACIVGYACVTEPPKPDYVIGRPGVGMCSDDPCLNDIGCGFDCTCVKFGSDRYGACARIDPL